MPVHPGHIKIKNVTLSGTEVSVYVSEYGAFFTYDPDGNELNHGNDMEDVIHGSRGNLRRRKITVEIPFRKSDGTRGVATGIHSGSKNVIVKYPGQRKQQLDNAGYAARGYLNGETPDDAIEQLRSLKSQLNAISNKITTIEREYGVDLNALVKDAIRTKLEAEDEAAWKVGAAGPASDTGSDYAADSPDEDDNDEALPPDDDPFEEETF